MDSRSDKKYVLVLPVGDGKDYRLSNNINQKQDIEKEINSSPKINKQ
jgi:hypothetical protein